MRAEAETTIPRVATEDLARLLESDLLAVEATIAARMQSPVGIIPDLAGHLVGAGGKRVRPMVTLASARAAAATMGVPLAVENVACLAAAVEFIHTATLLHDDVVDESSLRRGKAAAHRIWGNSASVLVGDFLFARAFNLMVETGSMRILDILAFASGVIAEGEVLQLANAANWRMTREAYFAIIEAKTAALFAAAAEAGAEAAGASPPIAAALRDYGRHLGLAFQLVDDALDYDGTTTTLGKNVGDDLRERKMTLPIIIARDAGGAEAEDFAARVFGEGLQQAADLDLAGQLIRKTDAIALTMTEAMAQALAAKRAIAGLAPGPYRDGLFDLADFAAARVQ